MEIMNQRKLKLVLVIRAILCKMQFRLKKRIMEHIIGTSESSKDVYLEGLNHNLEIQDRICFQIEHSE